MRRIRTKLIPVRGQIRKRAKHASVPEMADWEGLLDERAREIKAFRDSGIRFPDAARGGRIPTLYSGDPAAKTLETRRCEAQWREFFAAVSLPVVSETGATRSERTRTLGSTGRSFCSRVIALLRPRKSAETHPTPPEDLGASQ